MIFSKQLTPPVNMVSKDMKYIDRLHNVFFYKVNLPSPGKSFDTPNLRHCMAKNMETVIGILLKEPQTI